MKNLPPRTGDIEKIYIKEKLEEIGMPIDDLSLGDFDYIGEYTAKKARSQDSENWKKVGAFFRPNYERGILIYSLIKKFNIESFLEIGFGRGYGTMCAALAMHENGTGTVTTIDPRIDPNFIRNLQNIFPEPWFESINFIEMTSQNFFATLDDEDTYDFVYIDGDHTYEGVKSDWEQSKDRFNKFLLFDDYHLLTKNEDNDIECAHLIDQIEDDTKQLIIMDRRIFFDDRGLTDEEVDYGQVLLSKV